MFLKVVKYRIKLMSNFSFCYPFTWTTDNRLGFTHSPFRKFNSSFLIVYMLIVTYSTCELITRLYHSQDPAITDTDDIPDVGLLKFVVTDGDILRLAASTIILGVFISALGLFACGLQHGQLVTTIFNMIVKNDCQLQGMR